MGLHAKQKPLIKALIYNITPQATITVMVVTWRRRRRSITRNKHRIPKRWKDLATTIEEQKKEAPHDSAHNDHVHSRIE